MSIAVDLDSGRAETWLSYFFSRLLTDRVVVVTVERDIVFECVAQLYIGNCNILTDLPNRLRLLIVLWDNTVLILKSAARIKWNLPIYGHQSTQQSWKVVLLHLLNQLTIELRRDRSNRNDCWKDSSKTCHTEGHSWLITSPWTLRRVGYQEARS